MQKGCKINFTSERREPEERFVKEINKVHKKGRKYARNCKKRRKKNPKKVKHRINQENKHTNFPVFLRF